ncbi:DMT family transporter [Methylobacterium oxalidis]|uniref:DMT family transporter n=1 Tax=Methylobacterium oxalidis TaxID=944322 RepID=UPI00331623A7
MSTAWGWAMLIASGIVDVAWALATKKADGFREPGWAFTSLLLLALFVGLLTKALQVLPVGTAYAVWTGIGAVGSVGAGILLFGEPADATRLLFVTVTVVGIIGLKVAG